MNPSQQTAGSLGVLKWVSGPGTDRQIALATKNEHSRIDLQGRKEET